MTKPQLRSPRVLVAADANGRGGPREQIRNVTVAGHGARTQASRKKSSKMSPCLHRAR